LLFSVALVFRCSVTCTALLQPEVIH